ncbi:uncharacterized protein LOC108916870 isoform X2 [Anoplophora glabripennis]|uniref:uncharacterized protein LOC108916870 isoform X2 n=1 Tax=Anoplophora glabripennis TaxID=217634 RepID=UPI000874E524|nr:uncharacterized protein LOC108916870 isoform X2 [Anoplophora glabripennis]
MRSAWLSLLLQFWLFIQIYSGRSSFRPKTVRIYQFKGICPGHEDIPVYYSDIEVVNINRTFRVSLKANIRSDINNDMKGVYEFKNSTFDGSAFNRFPVLNWYWKVLVNIKDEITDELLQCATLEGQIAPI